MTRLALDLAPELDRLVGDLQRLAARCRLLVDSVGGEPDVRIEVCCPDDERVVELLCFGQGGPAAPRWHAVRIDDDLRQVWQGPPNDCPRADVVRFVADLLKGADGDLDGRYLLLG